MGAGECAWGPFEDRASMVAWSPRHPTRIPWAGHLRAQAPPGVPHTAGLLVPYCPCSSFFSSVLLQPNAPPFSLTAWTLSISAAFSVLAPGPYIFYPEICPNLGKQTQQRQKNEAVIADRLVPWGAAEKPVSLERGEGEGADHKGSSKSTSTWQECGALWVSLSCIFMSVIPFALWGNTLG